MTTVKQFECEHCGAQGKVSLRGTDYEYNDIVCCPVCGGDIYDDDDDTDERHPDAFTEL